MSNIRTEHEIEIDRIHDQQMESQRLIYEETLHILTEQIIRRNQIIRELCDALEGHDWQEGLSDLRKNELLIQRSREATR